MTSKTNLILHTVAGGLEVIYVTDFLAKIEKNEINGDKIVIPFVERPKSTFDFSIDSAIFGAQGPTITQKVYDLKPQEITTTGQYYSSTRGPTDDLYERFADTIKKFKEDEFKIMVAQKHPEFFIKDLDFKSIHEMSSKYYQRAYNDDCYGFHVDLGKYQKFFVISSTNDFKFYYTTPELIKQSNISSYDHSISLNSEARLINVRPDSWVLGRYENLTYLEEMNNQRRYVPQ